MWPPRLPLSWLIPFASNFFVSDLNIGILFILAVSSLGIYGIILGGWSSNSHYPLLGALRSSAQLVSYEVAAGIAIVGVILISNSLSMVEIVKQQQHMGVWNVFLQPLGFFIYLVASIAESNRNPFDLPEAESELTAGFHTEYSGFRFSLFFMAEYAAMILVSCIAVTLFFGGWLRPFEGVGWLSFSDTLRRSPSLVWPSLSSRWRAGRRSQGRENVLDGILCDAYRAGFGARFSAGTRGNAGDILVFAKVFVFLYAFIWYRGTFPRYRYDQLMNLGWHWMIPLALANVIVTAVVLYLVSPHPAAAVPLTLVRFSAAAKRFAAEHAGSS